MLDSTVTTNRPVRNMPPMYGPETTRARLVRQCARYTGEKVRIIPPNRCAVNSTLIIGSRAVSVNVQDGRVHLSGYSMSNIAPYDIDHEFAVKKVSGKRDILAFLEVFNHPLTQTVDADAVARREIAHLEQVEAMNRRAREHAAADKVEARLMRLAQGLGIRTSRVSVRPESGGRFTLVLSDLTPEVIALLLPHLR